jgi:UDP-N-acetylglucosamine diphosphorylase/glucosamine-1-phosphate N-acetyltransferase
MHAQRTPTSSATRLCLFEDASAADLEPLSLTRPVFELLCGMTKLAEKHCRFFGLCDIGVLVRPYLAELCRRKQPRMPVNDIAWLQSGTTILVNGRWLPPVNGISPLPVPSVGVVGEQVAYAAVGMEQLRRLSHEPLDTCLESWQQDLATHPAGGQFIRHGWELVHHNAEQLQHDFDLLADCTLHRGLTVVGPPEHVHLEQSARVEPMVLFDTTRGPIMIDRDTVVTAFSRIEGPCYIGPRTQVHGAKLRGGVTLGPDCRIGGEVEASIVHGHSNKVHDGFLGHSYVGEWVNLGAGTQSSDLRNDYGEVAVTVAGRQVASGMTKAGCLLGDHTKTGLGTLLNTGTNAGAFCNLLPGGLLPRHIPSFCSWWNATLADNADLPALLETARTIMARRSHEMSEAEVAVYRTLFELTAAERRRAIRDGALRRMRRSA